MAELDVQALEGRPGLAVTKRGQLDLALAPVAAVGQVLVEEARVAQELGEPERQCGPLIEQAREQAGRGLLSFGIVVSLWSVSAVAFTLTEALNAAYGVE